jgi:3-methylfumaryl-CoA hydratase
VSAYGPLYLGREARRRSEVVGRQDKQGRSGPLTFVTVRHTIEQDGRTAVVDRQDIVYLPGRGGSPARPAEVAREGPPEAVYQPGPPSALTLFQFSALTYNAHRIHYDRDYAGDVEGYPGLVVHGPLQAMLMAEAVRRRRPVAHPGTRFAYRLVAPVFDHEGLVVSASTADPSAGEDRGQPEPTGAAPTDLTTRVRSRVAGHTSATGIYRPGPCSRPAS